MINIFEINDKSGRRIRLTKRQWAHTMKKHSYMEKYIEEIKETIQYPQKIINTPKNKGYYYKNYKNLKAPNHYILVVVKYLNGTGFVITSYLMEKIR